MNKLSLPLNRLSSLLVTLYRSTLGLIGPPTCRFTPTCSEYALNCYAKDSWLKATSKVLGRLMRCHPFHRGGLDPA